MKSGIDYFPLDCELDDKIALVEAEFGLIGFAVDIKLWQRIYAGQGYYCEWNSEVELLFARKLGVGGNSVSEIVQAALKRGVFDKDIFGKYNVLTSKGIQVRYLKAIERRKKVRMEQEYLLLSADEISKNVYIFKENACIFPKNADNPKQSKVEESKVKESRVEQAPSASPTTTLFTRETLVEQYGSANVIEYEQRFDKWKAKKGGKIKANRYETIAKMLLEDGVAKPTQKSSFDTKRIKENVMKQYMENGRKNNDV